MLEAPDRALQKSLECKVQWYETQMRREVELRQAEAAKHAQQQDQLQASRDDLQKRLAVTEAEFRLALQVKLPLFPSMCLAASAKLHFTLTLMQIH